MSCRRRHAAAEHVRRGRCLNTGAAPEELKRSADRLDDLLGCARAHAATRDTRVWIDDLERMLAVAWDLMTTEQRLQFRDHPDIVAFD